MSLQIIKQGLLDTLQDGGRYGYQHLGINVSGAMDRFAYSLSNALLGKHLNDIVIELHFPAAEILFEQATVICLTGADFTPMLNGRPIPLNQPIIIARRSVLQFTRLRSGLRCYLSLLHGLTAMYWMGSEGTNLQAGAGGFQGRPLKTKDRVEFKDPALIPFSFKCETRVLDWRSPKVLDYANHSVKVVRGNEWNWLSPESKKSFCAEKFSVSKHADRMGYYLISKGLFTSGQQHLHSSGVTPGTVQLLPGGQLIILMADAQTTGGYPRIAHIQSIDLPIVAQLRTGEQVTFTITDPDSSEELLFRQKIFLNDLRATCAARIRKQLSDVN